MSIILAMAVQVAMVAAAGEIVKEEKGMKEKREEEKEHGIPIQITQRMQSVAKCCRYSTNADTEWNLYTCISK